jgi:hypothetical protein
MIRQFPGIPGKRDKRVLSHIFGQLRIADGADGNRVDQVNVPANQLCKRRFRARFCVNSQQILISSVLHSNYNIRSVPNRTTFTPTPV